MTKNLVIVESPAKAKTIERFLGQGFVVKSSFGHVRDLTKKGLGVEIEKGFEPIYEVPADKQKVIQELKKHVKDAEVVWLASDEDREGEAIAWHLSETLKLKSENTRRIVFHEITKTAIEKAVKNPRPIDMHLVKAQQARRVLDRLVGFELSPLLWKKVKPALSAGRVQSVAVRLIVDREDEIRNFVSHSAFRITGHFYDPSSDGQAVVKAEYQQRFDIEEQARDFLNLCIGASFLVQSVEKKPAKRSPAPPFTTSTLQQEAARKLGFSVAKTMLVAQQLYESGKITYMRTDSVNLSDLALAKSKEVVSSLFGDNYVKTRKYKTKTKGAQEAHEAIRPAYLENQQISGDASQKRLYDLIWKRTIASQMSDAELEKTQINIAVSATNTPFIARGEVVTFDGFLKLYMESVDDENENGTEARLPAMKTGQKLVYDKIVAEQRFSQPPPRYSEASLVKKMEELGIGRPSTYSPTISTIQKREYVVKADKEGDSRKLTDLCLTNGLIERHEKTEKTGYEKNRIIPTDLGTLVNRFLEQYFNEIIDYHFTAEVEKVFDEIADGKVPWNQMIEIFHSRFHKKIEETGDTAERFRGDKLLGTDPVTGKKVFVKIGRYGPMAQLGETESDEEVRFAGLLKNQSIESVTLQEVLELFRFPKTVGDFEGKPMTVATGRFGPYVKHDNKFYSIGRGDNPQTIKAERAVEIILAKREKELANIIKTFDEKPGLIVMNGRFGPYIAYQKKNYKIPKNKDPRQITLEECESIISDNENKKPSGRALRPGKK